MTNILELIIEESDAGNNITVKDYLKKLLSELWIEGEGFSGKRPFGNSGWEYDLYKPLVKAKVVKGELNEDGYIDSVDEKKANKIILDAIKSL